MLLIFKLAAEGFSASFYENQAYHEVLVLGTNSISLLKVPGRFFFVTGFLPSKSCRFNCVSIATEFLTNILKHLLVYALEFCLVTAGFDGH